MPKYNVKLTLLVKPWAIHPNINHEFTKGLDSSGSYNALHEKN